MVGFPRAKVVLMNETHQDTKRLPKEPPVPCCCRLSAEYEAVRVVEILDEQIPGVCLVVKV